MEAAERLKTMMENRAGKQVVQPPKMRHVLLVDDNDVYADHLTCDLRSRDTEVTRVLSAAEAVQVLRTNHHNFDGIITDISMENQISGLKVLIEIRRLRFQGIVTVATTGLNSPIGFLLNRILLGKIFHSDYLIAKRPIQTSGKVIWLRA